MRGYRMDNRSSPSRYTAQSADSAFSDSSSSAGLAADGSEEGSACGREGCGGVLAYRKSENCSCHINPPCSSCTNVPLHCPVCQWEEPREYVMNDYTVKEDRKTGVMLSWKPRELDHTKIDWRSCGHTHFTMVKEGVYPEGTTQAEVRKKVDGTFGGRFEQFGGGRFRFIAYTD